MNQSPPTSLQHHLAPLGDRVTLPRLVTANQLSRTLQVTTRTLTGWAAKGVIPVALRQGRVLRFHPLSVYQALGIDCGSSNLASDATENKK